MKHTKKSEKLQNLILKNFIKFILAFVLCYLLFLILSTIFVRNLELKQNQKLEELILTDLDNKPFDEIDTSTLLSCHGGMQILDENMNVVYQTGNFLDASSYSLPELINKLSQSVTVDHLVRMGLITYDVELTTVNHLKDHEYSIIYQPFTGVDHKWYLCLEAIPSRYANDSTLTLMSPQNLPIIIFSGIFLAVFGILLLVLMIYLFSHRISKRIGQPIASLTEGLKMVTQGSYDMQLTFEAENELAQMRDTFNYMTHELKKAKEEKESYDKERQMLFSNIAHDIKTPITTIQGYSKALSEGLITSEEEKKEYYDGLYHKSIRVNDLLNLLLTYTKLENRDFKLHLETLDLIEFLRKILAENYQIIEEKELSLEIQLPEDSTLFYSFDRIELDRAITNLLGNAVKHNPAGTTITVTLTYTSTLITIDFSDDGVPIPSELEQNLFEPFILGDQSRTSQSGNGLGLSISKKIIEKHGGNLTLIQSEISNPSFVSNDTHMLGTKIFRITLPMKENVD